MKVSYRTLPNLGHIIASHNAKIIGKGEAVATKRKCSCPEKDKPNCPLDCECLAENIIYQAKIEALPPKRARLEDEVEKDPRVLKVQTYMGRTKPPWKSRRDNHTASFKNIGQRTDSGLSKYVWDLKGLKRGYKINWSLITKSSSYSPPPAACRHKTPLLLSKLK